MISQTYDLNLIPSQIPVTIHCSQYDDGSRTFIFNLYEGASAFELPVGASATFSGVKPDGLGFQYACTITGASQVSVDVALQMTAVAGDCPCKVTVYDTDSNVLGSALCVMDVERHPLQDDTVISSSDIPLVQEAVNWAAQFQPSDYVVKNQGVAQAGKVLGIGNDGMVTPVAGGGGSADTVTYDNTTSGLAATDVQNAIDEVVSEAYMTSDASDTTIDDADSMPFYDTSASVKKKITWANITTKIMNKLQVFIREQECINGSLAKGIEWDVDELMTLVRNGDFDKFAIGDYITDANTSIEFAIAAKNHYPDWAFAGGNTRVNHIVLMPFTPLATNYTFNSSNTNSGGYAGSGMPSNMETEYAKLSSEIRNYCQATRIFENNKGAWTYADRYMRLPTVTEVFGSNGWASTEGYSNGSPLQLPLCKSTLFTYLASAWYWLLDPSSYDATSFCRCSNAGFGDYGSASNSGAVRPLIVLA